MKSYINLFRNYANFSGFLKRKPFWTAILIHFLVLAIPLVPGIFYCLGKSSLLPPALDLANSSGMLAKIYLPWVLPFWFFYFLLTRIPILSACVRRLHTLPRKGWWMLLALIPAAGSFILLIWMLQKGTYEDFEKRIMKAGANNDLTQVLHSTLLSIAEKPRKGGWFFVVLALLAAGGFFLNREVKKSGSVQTAIRNAGITLPASVAGLEFPGLNDVSGTEKTEVSPTEDLPADNEAETANEEPVSEEEGPAEKIVHLRVIPGEPVIPIKQYGDSASLGPDFFKTNHIGVYPAGDGVLAMASAVTAASFISCVEEGACEMPPELNVLAYRDMIPEEGKVTDSEHELGSLPMVYVTRDQAAAYCEWLGMRLPTADEWREAAKNSSVDEYTPQNSNCVGTDRSEYIKTEDQLALTVSVGAFRKYSSDYGMTQMAGNVWEWVTSEDSREGTALALGGAWNSYPSNVGPDARLETLAGYSADNIGFRCFVSEADLTSEFFAGGEPVAEDEPESAAEEITAEEIEAEPVEPEISDAEVIEAEPAEAEDSATAVSDGPAIEIIGGTIDLVGTDVDTENQTMTRPQDNAEMMFIPAATFNMGYSGGATDEKPVHEVSLSAYWIDVYEITNAQYALCVAEGVCTEPHETKSFRKASYYGNPDYDNYPVIYVDWQQASDYCTWTGSRLPTEAQWEYAAKGPDENRYPWGGTFEGTKLNYSGSGGYDTAAVDANPEDVSAFGVYDLGGNVSEWVYDCYLENWYTVTDQPNDPVGPENGSFRVIRGGSSQTGENNARTADRFYAKADTYNLDRGFRCARMD